MSNQGNLNLTEFAGVALTTAQQKENEGEANTAPPSTEPAPATESGAETANQEPPVETPITAIETAAPPVAVAEGVSGNKRGTLLYFSHLFFG